jgi:hypothetical protein
MLHLLTKYLLQYRTVTIPYIGTIQIIQHAPQVQLVDKQIEPPSFSAELKKEDEVSSHQLNFLNHFLQKGPGAVLEELKVFGNQLYDKINGPGFEWEGVGRLDRSTQSFAIPIVGLNTIAAERMMRLNPDHQVLVGDRETTSLQIADERSVGETQVRKRSVFVVIGWVLLVVSILLIGFFLYKGKFKVNASGSKQSAAYIHFNEATFSHNA